VVDDNVRRPAPALLWYPPNQWVAGETVVVETPAWYQPAQFAPLVSVYVGKQPLQVSLTPGAANPAGAGAASTVVVLPDNRLRLPARQRNTGGLEQLPYDWQPVGRAAQAVFGGGSFGASLLEYSMPARVAPGGVVPLFLRWEAAQVAAPPHDYTVFMHLLDEQGATVANADAIPSWFGPWPTSRWWGNGERPFGMWDAHALKVPGELAAGRYRVVTGFYRVDNGERLIVKGSAGPADEFELGSILVEPGSEPPADLCCLVAPDCCLRSR
jgi:hypothetical protein